MAHNGIRWAPVWAHQNLLQGRVSAYELRGCPQQPSLKRSTTLVASTCFFAQGHHPPARAAPPAGPTGAQALFARRVRNSNHTSCVVMATQLNLLLLYSGEMPPFLKWLAVTLVVAWIFLRMRATAVWLAVVLVVVWCLQRTRKLSKPTTGAHGQNETVNSTGNGMRFQDYMSAGYKQPCQVLGLPPGTTDPVVITRRVNELFNAKTRENNSELELQVLCSAFMLLTSVSGTRAKSADDATLLHDDE